MSTRRRGAHACACAEHRAATKGCRSTQSASTPARVPLNRAALAALDAALLDERQALATYRAILGRFGPVRPFVNIAASEERHISALLGLYRLYAAAAPPEPALTYRAPSTLREACLQAIQAEIDNAALYEDELLPSVAAYPDIAEVMGRLRDASRDRHLPAFRKCAERHAPRL